MSRSRAATAAHIVVATVGGYVVASAVIALLAVGLPRLTGLARSEAVLLTSMLGFIIYLVILVWGFSERSLSRLALHFAGLAICAISLVAIINRYGG